MSIAASAFSAEWIRPKPVKLYATYCSAKKDTATGLVPARERYTSDRITGVEKRAQLTDARFAILSGKFGLIPPDTPIADYDHLLQRTQLTEMTNTVAHTLEAWGVTQVHWFSVAFEMDPNVHLYKTVMADAAATKGIDFELEIWEPTGTLGLI